MKVKFTASLGFIGADRTEVVTIADEDLEGADETALETYILAELEEWRDRVCEIDFEIVVPGGHK